MPILDGRYGEQGARPVAAPVQIFQAAFAALAGRAKDESVPVPEDIVRGTAAFMLS